MVKLTVRLALIFQIDYLKFLFEHPTGRELGFIYHK